MIPKLQYALDTKTVEETLRCLDGGAGEQADVIELGSSLLFAEGAKAIRMVKDRYPDKELVADVKLLAPTARGSAPPLLEAGADAIIVVSSVNADMLQVSVEEIVRKRGRKLYLYLHYEKPDSFDDAVYAMWRDTGVTNVIYHSVNPGFAWGDNDTRTVETLCATGLAVTVTGKITLDRIRDFAGLPIYSFIIGTAIRCAPNPSEAIGRFQQEIRSVFGAEAKG